MKLLAVDSGGAQAGFAAIRSGPGRPPLEADSDPQLCGVVWLDDGRELSRQVVLCLDRALAAAGWSLDDIDAVALAAGPGSWTGLRIGFSACKTLAQVRCLPLIVIPTYDAIAAAAWREYCCRDEADALLLAVAGPCRAGQAYLKLFKCHAAGPVPLGPERIVPLSELADVVAAAARRDSAESSIYAAGPARATLCGLLSERSMRATALELGRDATLLQLGRLSLEQLQAGSAGDPLAAQPLYLAPSAAERALLEQRA